MYLKILSEGIYVVFFRDNIFVSTRQVSACVVINLPNYVMSHSVYGITNDTGEPYVLHVLKWNGSKS